MLWNMYNLMIADLEGSSAKAMLKYAGLEDKDLKWIQKRIKVITNKIRLKKESVKEETSKTKLDFWKIIDEIEDVKGRAIDITKTTVRKYIAIKKNIKRNGRQNRKK